MDLYDNLEFGTYGTPLDGRTDEAVAQLLVDLRENYGTGVTALPETAQMDLARYVFDMAFVMQPALGRYELGAHIDRLVTLIARARGTVAPPPAVRCE